MTMPSLMMVKEDYFTGSIRSRIIRWLWCDPLVERKRAP